VLRRRDRIVLSLGAETASVRRQRRGSLAWEIVEPEINNFQPALHATGARSDGMKRLTGLIKRLRDATGADVTLVVAPALCPGLIVQLGDEPLPWTLREKLAAHRLEQVYGVGPPTWAMRLDPMRVTGAALAFALGTELRAEITNSLSSLSARTVSIVPGMVWGLELLGRGVPDGWFVIDQVDEASIVYIQDGEITVLESDGTPHSISELVRAIESAALRHGINSPGAPITVVSGASAFPAGKHTINDHDVQVVDPFAPVKVVELPQSARVAA
jgi:hypothetical protein